MTAVEMVERDAKAAYDAKVAEVKSRRMKGLSTNATTHTSIRPTKALAIQAVRNFLVGAVTEHSLRQAKTRTKVEFMDIGDATMVGAVSDLTVADFD